jgi:hypothetical protein
MNVSDFNDLGLDDVTPSVSTNKNKKNTETNQQKDMRLQQFLPKTVGKYKKKKAPKKNK